MNFNCNSTSHCHHSATSHTLFDQTSRSSHKLIFSPDVSCARRSMGNLPKSIVSAIDNKNTPSKAVYGILKSLPTSPHTFLSPTL